jgi:hypothetical protein
MQGATRSNRGLRLRVHPKPHTPCFRPVNFARPAFPSPVSVPHAGRVRPVDPNFPRLKVRNALRPRCTASRPCSPEGLPIWIKKSFLVSPRQAQNSRRQRSLVVCASWRFTDTSLMRYCFFYAVGRRTSPLALCLVVSCGTPSQSLGYAVVNASMSELWACGYTRPALYCRINMVPVRP